VVELQGHGGPIVQQNLLQALCTRGARLARPGEFSERAFLNGKLDLVQAEAIADLIAAKSKLAAKAARSSLQGVFSAQVAQLAARLLSLRVEIEAAIDFPDEDIEILQQAEVGQKLAGLSEDIHTLLRQAEQGRRLSQGLTIALVGEPNVGKSSLLNALAGEEAAIVTAIPGTTRDLLKVDVVIDGMPLRLVDTAGLRESDDAVEQIGIERARQQIDSADRVAVVLAATDLAKADDKANVLDNCIARARAQLGTAADALNANALHIVINKIDLHEPVLPLVEQSQTQFSLVSATEQKGLKEFVAALVNNQSADAEVATFTARTRHVQALTRVGSLLQQAQQGLDDQAGPDLVAEDCQLAHQTLGEIVGTISPDELLGEIFSNFCIGK
jgi:tRNA modification GTPase